MALSTSNLQAFYDVDNKVVGAAILGMQSADFVNVVQGVKSNMTLNSLAQTVNLTTATCPSTDTGTTTFGKVALSPTVVNFYTELCQDDLEPYYAKYMKSGSYNQEIPFAQFVYEYIAKQYATEVDKQFWSNSSYGIAKLLQVGSASTTNVTLTTITASNGYAMVDAVWTGKQAALAMQPCILYMSASAFDKYLLSVRTANLYDPTSFVGNATANYFIHPGSGGRLKVVGIAAMDNLSNTSTMFLTNEDNLVMGLDSEQDMNSKQVYYSEDKDKVVVRIKGKLSTGVYFLNQVVRFATA